MQELKQYLEEQKIQIESLKLYKSEKRLVFSVLSETILSYEQIHQLEDACQKRNADLKKINIIPRYQGGLSEEKMLEGFLPNIHYILRKNCPAVCKSDCFEIYIDPVAEQKTVILNVLDEIILKSLRAKKVDLQIKHAIATTLGLDVRVAVKDSSEVINLENYFEESNKYLAGEAVKRQDSPKGPKTSKNQENILKGRSISGAIKTIAELGDMEKAVAFEGTIYASDIRKTRNKKILQSFVLNDNTGSIMCKVFWEAEDEILKNGSYIRVKADIMMDEYTREITANLRDISKSAPNKRKDNAEEKRVELHLHSNMSSMDAIENVKSLVKTAKEFGHTAVAITDHAVVQAFPDAMDQAQKSDIKVLYGVEGYLIDDTVSVLREYNNLPLSQEFVVFDIETTGLSSHRDKITEIGAVKIIDGKITDTYSQLVNPERPLSAKIVELTGITDDMLVDKPTIDQVLPGFLEFVGGSILVAHNSDFDTSFIKNNCENLGIPYNLKAIDTVAISRTLLKDLKSHKLNLVAKRLGVKLDNHHRAVDDATATAEIFLRFLDMFKENGVETLDQVNHIYVDTDYKTKRPNHVTVLAQNAVGLKNLYKIISDSHINHFYKTPRILKSVLNAHREGLLIGSACEAGQVYQAVLANRPEKEIEKIASYYDYLEIMPLSNNEFMIQKGIVNSDEDLKKINKRIFELGQKLGKPVVATGDVHYIEKNDSIIRDVLRSGQKSYSKDVDNGSLYFRTTEEMLAEFAYLGEENARLVVIENTNLIADMIENLKPVPDGTFPPEIEGSDIELREMCFNKARRIYGDDLPDLVEKRLERELGSIIGNGYAVMYIIAQKLVTKSIEEGYLVGSRGSVGSSFAATMSDITEVNPLPPHYICAHCKYSEFVEDGSVGVGMDLPDKKCPVCNAELAKEGHDIPFEVFLGFKGDKEPDIDLNFAGEYQSRAHKYTEELFGKDYVFRAGTIGTIAEKTAYGYVMKYQETHDIRMNTAHTLALRDKSTGVKRTTGQHPGGVMVVPGYKDIYDFTPIQHPANDSKSGVLTTHFDYNSISGRILKLDILGHDVPTIIKMLEDLTGVDAVKIPLDDKGTMGLFTSEKPLGCDLSAINCETGTLGIPEFGTRFVRQMLLDTRPSTFAELIRISGLSHGTDVWIGNAQELIRKNTATLKDVISTRDDIMNYLIFKGLEPLMAFKVMENVRKGKGLTDEHIEAMKERQIPPWYIESCQKIKYMFPKAHASAYVTMSFRIAYFKLYHKEAFYATYFTTKAADFDVDIISRGIDAVLANIKAIEAKGNEATNKELDLLTVLESAYEMYKRGVQLLKVDIYKSHATQFKVVDQKLLPPLISVPGLGETVAKKIYEEAQEEFISLEDFRKRTKASKTVVEMLQKQGCLQGIPESNQLSLF